MPNIAPAGTNLTRSIPRSYALHKGDFGFTDSDGNAFKAVVITSLPTGGTLYYDSNGPLGGGRIAVVAGQVISVADILAGKLTYVAPAGISGANYDHFTFEVRDDGGTVGGGQDTDQSPNTLTFDLVASAATSPSFGKLIDLTGLSAPTGFKILGDANGDDAGRRVSSAGDLNGDGYADFILGDYRDSSGGTSAGAVYVIFGKASGFGAPLDLTNLAVADGFKIQGDVTGDEAGSSVSSAGDVNGDGFTDIIVGALNNSSGGAQAGAAYVIFGKASGFGSLLDLTNLTATDGFKIQGDLAGDHAGVSVSAAGDVNGDGFADIVVGANNNDGGGADAGAAYVIFGKAGGFGALVDLTGLTAATGFKIQGDVAGDYAGKSVSTVGDVNGDGFADILIGAPRANAAYVIFGKASGFGSLVDLTGLTAGNGFRIQGDPIGGNIGYSVSAAGDVNGDGYADIVLGANSYNGAGAAYVIFGKAGGFGNLIDLAGLSATEGFKIRGELAGDRAGYSVSAAGDVNGDGLGDIIVGAQGNDSGGNGAGAAYVIFGKAGGFGSLIDLGSLSAVMGFKIQGDGSVDNAGFSVSAAGDVNGDGFADLAVGAPNNNNGGNRTDAYLIFGHATLYTAPAGADRTVTIPRSYILHKSDFGFSDTDGNDLKAVIIDSLPTGGTLYYDRNGQLGGGRTAVVAGQTISAADILAGHLTYVAPAGASGTNYAHFTFQVRDDGGSTGGNADTDLTPNTLTFNLVASAATPASFGGLIDLTGLPASAGFKIQGDLAFDQAGFSVSSAGDVNGDGFADVIVGAPGNDSGGNVAGAAYVIFGKASGFSALIDLTSLAATDGFKIQGDVAMDYAGVSVSAAGDVNGDGFADIIVGAEGNGSGGVNAGAAYVIFGKASGFGSLVDLTGLAAANGFKIQGDLAGDFAGYSVSGAGDINGDGFADLIVGAYGSDSGGDKAGAAYVIFGKAAAFSTIDLTALAATDGFKIQGDFAGDFAGFSVSSAGDINGDGYADIIIGAAGVDRDGDKAGAAYVIFGKAGGFGTLIDLSSLAAGDGFKIAGGFAGDYAGHGVSSAGDVNGDGYADLLVGAPGHDSGGPNAGAAYVIFGGTSGFGSLLDLSALTAGQGFKIQGDVALDDAGWSVSAAGDVNGDGFADILIGAVVNDSGGNAAGAAYVIFGKASGFGSLIDLANLHAVDGFKIQGDVAGDKAGVSVSAAGDVNGDGYDDIIVGADLNAGGGTNAGAAYVIFGHANSFSAPAGIDRSLTIARSHVLQESDFGFTDAEGNGLGAIIVTSLPGAGRLYYDANGTLGGGLSPVIAGQAISAADIFAGKLFYVAAPGSAGGTSDHFTFQVRDDSGAGGALDTDQSANMLTFNLVTSAASPTPFGSLIDLTGLSSANGFKIQGDLGGDYAGTSVASAGDVNGDGFVDIIVGASGNDSGGSSAGAAYVIFGKASGFANIVDLTGLSVSDGFKIQGDLAGDIAGISVSSAGDINGDGFADLIVGASHNDSGGNYSGAAYVIFGKASGFGTLIDLTGLSATDGFRIQGDVAGNFAGCSVSSAGDFNGDGFADIIIGAYGDGGGGANAGAAYLIFGHAGGFGAVIDLTALSAAVGFKFQGDLGDDRAGFSVSSAGDVNGDGFADLIVGAKTNDGGGGDSGAAYVIFGRSGGLGGLIDLSALAATDGFKIQGDASSDYAGISVASAGDINGDGFADIMIGASNAGNGGIYAPGVGAAYVIYGKAGGFGSLIDLTGLSATVGFKIQGNLAGDNAGFSVTSAGDVNGDGYADLLVGESGDDGGGIDAGAAYLIFGKASGFGSTINLASLTAADGFKIQGDNAGDVAGRVSAAGDINGDGFADILIGATGNSSGGGNAGAAYVIFGHATAASTAGNDNGLVAENAAGTINVLANDVDTATGRAVARIGSQVITVGAPVTLASGAIVSLNGDGTLTYNPNHAFDATPAAGSGASNTPAHDSFTYTLFGGGTGTVSVTISGIDNNDVLLGTPGADTLIGGPGADAMIGGTGDDVYFVDNVSDQVVEAVGEGNDRLFVSASYALTPGAEVEVISTDWNPGTDPIDITGNEFANAIIGNEGANSLSGGAGNDTLVGNGGNDVLFGGAGVDVTVGGAGDDVHFVDSVSDLVIEAVGGGNDRVFAGASYALAAGSEVEVLSTDWNPGTDAINLVGNEFANAIIGNEGANSLDGGAGNDTLVGNGGNDVLTGGAGVDVTVGGAGDDLHFVDSASDLVIELVGGGNDHVFASASYALSAGYEIETLSTDWNPGTDAINLTGNEFANTVIGNEGANSLNGGAGNDTLIGNGGNDTLIGGTGIDVTNGGAGDDLHFVDNAADVVVEGVGQGNDRVLASVSYTLSAGAEVEILSTDWNPGTDAINLTGNEFANTVIGNEGANVLNGGAGSDSLVGNGGADTFAFSTALSANNVDTIIDFAHGTDRIGLDHGLFGLAAGALNAGAFVAGTQAGDADDRIIYDATAGNLFFDADGNGAGAAVMFAHVTPGTTITASDFQVI